MRNIPFAATFSGSLLIPLAPFADNPGQAQPVPVAAMPSRYIVCEHAVHEGMIVRRATCLPADAVAAEKERNQQEIRRYQTQNLYIRP